MQQPTSGWIKLFRSLSDHGHLQMPDQALKIFIYLLLEVNHTPNAGCAAGEGWITYRRIREACCDPSRPQWSDHTISGALDHLERGGYIRRIKTKVGAAQRIRILNWQRYQGQSSVLTAEVRAEVGAEVPAVVRAELGAEKQECREGKEGQEAAVRPAPAPLPPDLITTLQGQVSKRLVLMQIAELHRTYGEKRMRFAGTRVAEEKAQRAEAGRDALGNPVARFMAILKASSEEEAEAYFEEQQALSRRTVADDDQDGPPAEEDDESARRAREQARQLRLASKQDHEDPRDRIRRERATAMAAGAEGVVAKPGGYTGPRPLDTREIE